MHFTFVHNNINVLDLEKSCICYENKEMGLYFIVDPDGYWTEILPVR
ncbi:hypothetical protein CLHOM_29150 [Clostridium homopropionicum DSM 5847]|uniref:Glyoxalase-like domain protein n=1 Tax=Clostridium homopropionicum DSM 5847 TaxID=1121318 RepID=A0A0L6Z6P6_9CLOT|nr:hypothetical protein CLHOM_29150 [Clostridium homopropionicum DSM 5847]SFG50698.1 lactoylglutathione lyase [Clostridium homopropionicum]